MKAKERARMKDQILKHGFDLLRIFRFDTMYDANPIGPVQVAKKVHRLEAEAHRQAERICNGEIELTDDEHGRWEAGILNRLDKILGFRALGVLVFINGDPRGYALKIDDKYVKDHNLEIHRDWGGYGILAPEFDGTS